VGNRKRKAPKPMPNFKKGPVGGQGGENGGKRQEKKKNYWGIPKEKKEISETNVWH